MCIDSHDEMKAAWKAMIAAGMPEEAVKVFHDVSKVSYEISGQGDAGLDSRETMLQAERMEELGEWFREITGRPGVLRKRESDPTPNKVLFTRVMQ